MQEESRRDLEELKKTYDELQLDRDALNRRTTQFHHDVARCYSGGRSHGEISRALGVTRARAQQLVIKGNKR